MLLVIIIVAATWGLLKLWQTRRIAAVRHERIFGDLIPAGRPAIVSFSTPSCAECRTRQAPALKRLSAEFGPSLTVHSLLAHEHPDLVDRLGILTVPATVVLDADGRVQHTNLGFTDTPQLAAQARTVTARMPGPPFTSLATDA